VHGEICDLFLEYSELSTFTNAVGSIVVSRLGLRFVASLVSLYMYIVSGMNSKLGLVADT